jgi:hypothetical protein
MLVVTPGFVWSITKPSELLHEWSNFQRYSSHKFDTFFAESRISYVEDLRWENKKYTHSDMLSRFFYNKLTVVVDDIFNYLTFISPRFYFQSGGGSNFSPQGVEPIAAAYYVFFVLGIVFLLKNKRYKIFYFILTFSFLAYLSGKRNLAFLLPVLISYIYVSYVGISISPTRKGFLYGLYILLSLFLIGRSIWVV